MATKRMFSKEIVGSDAFLDMPVSSQLLYFHLGMEADDDGFIASPKRVGRLIGSGDDDLKILSAKRFILVFPSGVIVIKHHRINNNWDKYNCKRTPYLEEFGQLFIKPNKAYTMDKRQGKSTVGKQTGSRLKPVFRIEENRIEEKRIEKKRKEEKKSTETAVAVSPDKSTEAYLSSLNDVGYVMEIFRRHFGASPKPIKDKSGRVDLSALAAARLVKTHGRERLRKALEFILSYQNTDKYCRISTTPLDFEKNWSWYQTYIAQKKNEKDQKKPIKAYEE